MCARKVFLFLIIGLLLSGCASMLNTAREQKEATATLDSLRKNPGTNTDREAIARFLVDGEYIIVTLIKKAEQDFLIILPDERFSRIDENAKGLNNLGSFVLGALPINDVLLLVPFDPRIPYGKPERGSSTAEIMRSLIFGKDIDVRLMLHRDKELYPVFLNSYTIVLDDQAAVPVARMGYTNIGKFKMQLNQHQDALLLIPSE